jgi:S1-C subfamily serine protease
LTILLVPAGQAGSRQSDDILVLEQKAIRAALGRVSPSIVQIETSGGTDFVTAGRGVSTIQQGTGPTTGVIVDESGYVISSAFNFVNKPAAILVSVPGRTERYVARIVSTDHLRMLTLLKIDLSGLPVPAYVPRKDIKVGEWALALGRTWTAVDTLPSVSVGIVSALGRIWGKAIQTDAKVSPVNYGGPLVDIQGRVLGILIPASPRGQDEAAGVEWYDSGIGFAIPMEDVINILPRLKKEKELRKGLLGITVQGGDLYGATPVVAGVAHGSVAQRAGIKPGDAIVAINGMAVGREAQALHILGTLYEGDAVSVRVRRDGKEINFKSLKLAGPEASRALPFIGILPMRDDPPAGEEIRFVYPRSPARRAGLQAGDRIVAWRLNPINSFARVAPPVTRPDSRPIDKRSGRDELFAFLSQLDPGTEIQLAIKSKRRTKMDRVNLVLDTFPNEIPDHIPAGSCRSQSTEEPADSSKKPRASKKPETGLLRRADSENHRYKLWVPENYDAGIAHALVVWLHTAGKRDDLREQMLARWKPYCSEKHFIMLLPESDSENGWTAGEADWVVQAIGDVASEYTVDRQRIVAHGMGDGAQLAFYLGFHARDWIRGVAVTSTIMNVLPKEPLSNKRLSFYLVARGKDSLLSGIQESKSRLAERKFPLIYKQVSNMDSNYLDEPTLGELIRWIDSLDWQ